MNVTLRQRKKGDKISLYLDYYSNGKREYEYLKLYLKVATKGAPLTKEEKNENKSNLELAESIRSKRHLEIKNGIYGFSDSGKMKGSFIKYFEYLTEKRNDSDGNYGNWDSTLKHINKYVNNADVTFNQIDKKWLEDFKEYLIKHHDEKIAELCFNNIHDLIKKIFSVFLKKIGNMDKLYNNF